MKKAKLAALALTAMSATMTSCLHKDLYMDDELSSRLIVEFDWRDAPDADPESMAFYLYGEDGTSPARYIFANKTGGEIKAEFGLHHAIAINADNTDWARLRRTESIETMEISTQDAADLAAQGINSASLPRTKGTESERMAATPGMLWAKRSNNISVVPHQGTDTITVYPHEAVCHYVVDVLDVSNLGGVSTTTIDANLSGMAEAYCAGTDAGTDTPVTMNFQLRADKGSDSLHGEFLTFGECANTVVKHYLTVYMVLSDGSKWWHSFDVTDQVSKAPDPRHVHIIVSGLPLPEPPGDQTPGFKPDVNDWQVINVELKM